MSVEFKKDLLYRQLKEAILSGKYPPGSKFPCEVDFASQLGVAFVTLRSALKRLEDDGLITRLRSRGTFVNELSSSAVAEKNSRRKILLLFRGKVHLESMEANVFNRQLAFGVFSQSAFHGMSADLKIIPLDMPWEKQVLYAENNGYSAMILDRYSQELQDQIVRRKTALPLVLVNREVDGIPSVCCNYVSAIRMAIQHLRELGHRQILLLDHGNETAVFRERQAAFLDEMARGGVRSPKENLLTMGNVQWKDYLSRITAFMQAHSEMTAAIVQSFYMRHFAEYLGNSGVSVPGDLSVIQWGERSGYERNSPTPFSLLTEPRTECGQAAVDLIARMLDGEDCSSYHFKINAELIMRNGCALPRTLRPALEDVPAF